MFQNRERYCKFREGVPVIRERPERDQRKDFRIRRIVRGLAPASVSESRKPIECIIEISGLFGITSIGDEQRNCKAVLLIKGLDMKLGIAWCDQPFIRLDVLDEGEGFLGIGLRQRGHMLI